MKYRAFKHKFLRHFLTTFFIFLPFIPTIILHVFIEIYHQIGFRLCGLRTLDIRNYIRFDREKLSYLSFHHKIYCSYCAYMNGVYTYFVDIAAETEGYWCGIKHIEDKNFRKEPHQEHFAAYGSEEEFLKKYPHREI
jgi:hypothetical protein